MDPEIVLRLLEINKRLAGEPDLTRLLETVMDSVIELTGAQRGFLILVEDGKVRFQTARNFGRTQVDQPELKVSQTVVRAVIQSGRPVLTDNAAQDPRLQDAASVAAMRLISILVVPLRVQDRVLGALYVDNPTRRGTFGEKEKQVLSAFADQASIAIRALWRQQQVEELNQALEQRLETKSRELERVERALDTRPFRHDYSEIVGRGRRMREILIVLDKVVEWDVPVLIQGESGTGKELVARAIHRNSRRREGPFVPVNCGAIAPTLLESEFFGHVRGAFTGATENKIGLFEQAEGGTLFLDEIGEMDLDMQKKLLRALQEREVRPVGGKTAVRFDVRLVFATNKNLRREIEAKTFREDLYYRISVIPIDLPPLRERPEDVPPLAEFFVEKFSREMGVPPRRVTPEAMELLKRFHWPGNVRRLENEIRKALALSEGDIAPEDLSLEILGDRAEAEGNAGPARAPDVALVPGARLKETMERTEKAAIERALQECAGNQTRAAKQLGISRVWLRKKMERYGLLPGPDAAAG